MASFARGALIVKKGIRWVETLFTGVGGIALTVIMFLGAADVIGRYFFNRPITGTQEICLALMGVALFLSWAGTQATRGHLGLDILYNAYPPRVRAVLDVFMLCVNLVLMVFIGWAGALVAANDIRSGLEIDVIGVPIGPLKLLIPIGAAVFVLECIVLMVHRVGDIKTGKES